jgi:hypothetical protein
MAENEYNLTIDRQIKKRFNRGWNRLEFSRLNPAKGVIKRRTLLIWFSLTQKTPYFRDCFTKDMLSQVLVSDIFVEFPY